MSKLLYLLILTSVVSIAKVGDTLIDSTDVGKDIPVKNYPIGFVYVEYPQISDTPTAEGNGAPCVGREAEDLNGIWVKIDHFDGSFLRTEGKGAREFDAVNFNLSQNQSTQKHTHNHSHMHTHEVGDHYIEDHNHEHEHDMEIRYSEAAAGTTAGINNYVIQEDQSEDSSISQDSRTSPSLYGAPVNEAYTKGIVINDVKNYTYEPDDTQNEENGDEIRPRNYVVRIWQKIAESLGCILASYVYENEYEELTTTYKDKNNKFIKTEINKKLISRKPMLGKDGSYLLRKI